MCILRLEAFVVKCTKDDIFLLPKKIYGCKKVLASEKKVVYCVDVISSTGTNCWIIKILLSIICCSSLDSINILLGPGTFAPSRVAWSRTGFTIQIVNSKKIALLPINPSDCSDIGNRSIWKLCLECFSNLKDVNVFNDDH